MKNFEERLKAKMETAAPTKKAVSSSPKVNLPVSQPYRDKAADMWVAFQERLIKTSPSLIKEVSNVLGQLGIKVKPSVHATEINLNKEGDIFVSYNVKFTGDKTAIDTAVKELMRVYPQLGDSETYVTQAQTYERKFYQLQFHALIA